MPLAQVATPQLAYQNSREDALAAGERRSSILTDELRRGGFHSGNTAQMNMLESIMSNTSYLSAEFEDYLSVQWSRPDITPREHAPDLDAWLRSHNISHISAEYCGAEDQGGFISVQFSTSAGAGCLVTDGVRLSQLKNMLQDLLLMRHSNWCRDNGSGGDFRWDLDANTLVHTHYSRGNGNERLTHHGLPAVQTAIQELLAF